MCLVTTDYTIYDNFNVLIIISKQTEENYVNNYELSVIMEGGGQLQ